MNHQRFNENLLIDKRNSLCMVVNFVAIPVTFSNGKSILTVDKNAMMNNKKSGIFTISRSTDIDCILIHNF